MGSKQKHSTDTFYADLALHGIPLPIEEYRFAPPRRFRFDYCWTDYMLALEVEGGVWTGGRHITPKGFLNDIEKYNIASALGYRIIRTTPSDLLSAEFRAIIRACLGIEPLIIS